MHNLDTHQTIKDLMASGISEAQAEAITNAINDISNVATKEDIKDLRRELKDVQNDISNVATKEDIKDLQIKIMKEIDQKFTSLLMWMISLFGTTVLSILALIITIFFNKG